ncbi:SDR family NAD(P)-dependent oxidoreductase [Cesiribacter sp. SM1]|uniref:SDR family NAD(P)-dependent oxidoreductase n=1 Tax=Cesiribacter sp. SM1 TaxID=2861196 RepID=UPI001CD66D2D|nr:SDR family NAD(P)-dependent oxidoreductase [Cesiribacter sp. SM1]
METKAHLSSAGNPEAGLKKNHQRTAVITGAGEGLGREMALILANKGYRVFGTALSEKEVLELASTSSNRVSLTITDITDEAAVQHFNKVVASEIGQEGINLLISNVGILTPGPMEAITVDALRHEFEVDVFGAVRVINTFLPLLRKTQGRIVQISSYSGKFSVPFSGPSSACKAALESLADAYRTELKPFGVDFIVAEPGNMRTNAPAKSAAAIKKMQDRMTPELHELYGAGFASFEAAFNSLQDAGLPAATAAAMIIDLAEQQPAPARAPIGEEAARVIQTAHDKSDAELDEIRLSFLGLDKLDAYTRNRKPAGDKSSENGISSSSLDPGIAIVRRNTEEVQGKGNYDVFEELFAADFIDHTPQPGGFSADREGARELYKKLREAFPDFHAEIHWQTTDGDRVTTFKTYHGTHQGTFWGLAPTGKKIHFETVDVMRVREGKITEHWGVANLFSLLQQFDLGPDLGNKKLQAAS